MLTQILRPAAVLVFALSCSLPLSAQEAGGPKVNFPAPSPASTLKQRVGLTDIEIEYSRPGVKGRHIFGAHEPYGAVWRTGANSATKITFSAPIKFNGQDVPAGTYGLFTVPGKDEWTVILNEDPNQWGAYKYDASKDILRVTAKPIHLSKIVETFTIDIADIRDESATLTLAWENTLVPVSLQIDVLGKVLPEIDAAMASGEKKNAGLYINSAQFYYDHNQDLNKALDWTDQAIALNPKDPHAGYLKAEILAKQGKREEAIAAATKSAEVAAASSNDDGYGKLDQALISSLR